MSTIQTDITTLEILNLDCGRKKRLGAIGVDYSDWRNADVIHDLNVSPYPFENGSINQVYLDNVLEHLDKHTLEKYK